MVVSSGESPDFNGFFHAQSLRLSIISPCVFLRMDSPEAAIDAFPEDKIIPENLQPGYSLIIFGIQLKTSCLKYHNSDLYPVFPFQICELI